MNSKANTLGLAMIVAVTIFIVGMISINFIKTEVTSARDATNLDCSNAADISDGTKLTCLMVDLVVPYFILTIFSVAGGLIVARFVV
jgi:hypothetical protein